MRIIPPLLPVALALAALVPPARAQDAPPPRRQRPVTETIRIVARPAPAPVPAFKYRFIPELVDQTPGNAAFLYLTAAQDLAAIMGRPESRGDQEKLDQWLGMAPSALPREEVRTFLDRHANVLNHLRQARLRDRCDFETNYRTEGFGVLLPYLNYMRQFANLLRLSIALNVAEGRFNRAVDDMSVVYAIARHMTEQPFLVQVLVASGINTLGLQTLQQFVPAENSPNLYWALGDLPRPMVDLRAAMRYERAGVYFSVPQLKDARDGRITASQWHDALDAIGRARGLSQAGRGPGPEHLVAPVTGIRDYAAGKRFLVGQMGMPGERVEAMEVAAVIGMYHVAMYEQQTQEYDKWLTVPFRQGFEKLLEHEKAHARHVGDHPWSLSALFVPATSRFVITVKKVERQLAAWRTVEALRAHAAATGKLPERLEEMKETPAIIDPMTDAHFDYTVEGDSATIEGKPIEAAKPNVTGIRIELTLVR